MDPEQSDLGPRKEERKTENICFVNDVGLLYILLTKLIKLLPAMVHTLNHFLCD